MKLKLSEIPVLKRHSTVFKAYDELPTGGSIEIEVDHDPRRLHAQFQVERAGVFSWSYLEKGPELWRVQIAKVPAGDAVAGGPEEGCCGCCGIG